MRMNQRSVFKVPKTRFRTSRAELLAHQFGAMISAQENSKDRYRRRGRWCRKCSEPGAFSDG